MNATSDWGLGHMYEQGRTLVLRRFVPYRLSVLSRGIVNALAKKYKDEFSITIPEWRVMSHLAEVKTCSSGDIVARTAMDHAKVNRAVTRLAARGLVLAGLSQHDRRVNVLHLSTPGRKIYEKIVPIALGFEDLLLEALTEEELNSFLHVLSKLQKRISQLEEFEVPRPNFSNAAEG